MVNASKSTYTVVAKKARLSVDCTVEQRLKIKLAAAIQNKTIIQFVMDCVNEKLADKLDDSFTAEDIEDSIDAIEARRKLKPGDRIPWEKIKEELDVQG